MITTVELLTMGGTLMGIFGVISTLLFKYSSAVRSELGSLYDDISAQDDKYVRTREFDQYREQADDRLDRIEHKIDKLLSRQ